MKSARLFSIFLVRPLRVLILSGHILIGLMMAALIFPWAGAASRGWFVGFWTKSMLHIVGISLHVSGTPPCGKALLVANHVSWVDPFLLLACLPVHFVAKAEIQSWPVLGWLVSKAGTVFIRRDRQRDLARVTEIFEAHLHDNAAVGLFPESTSSDGEECA